MMKKENYAAPATEVLELRLEGVIAGSDDPQMSGGTSLSINAPYVGEGEDW